MNPSERAAVTYRYDLRQAFFQGICETSWVTLGLLVAIRGFGGEGEVDGGTLEWVKGLIPAAGSIGMLLTPFFIAFAARLGWPATQVIALFVGVAGVFALAAALSSHLLLFAGLWLVAIIFYTQQMTMMTQVYAWNYDAGLRGKRFATTYLVAACGGLVYSLLWGFVLDRNFSLYPLFIGVVGVSCLFAASLIRRIPAYALQRRPRGSTLRNFSLAWKDRLFGVMLLCWMFIGIGNMMTIPIRVEYLANPLYGVNASNAQVALCTVIIPFAVRFASARAWGVLFDRMHFVPWRILVNLCFVFGTLFYFMTTSMAMVYVGAVFFGLALGGAGIAWNLWVTKIAEPHLVSDYMGVHTTLTGVRGTLSPFFGYWLLTYSAGVVSFWAITFLMIATVIFVLLYKHPRFRDAH